MGNYVNPAELKAELAISKKEDNLTPKAIDLLMRMNKEVIRQMRYKYEADKQDCMAEAMFDILKYWRRYDPENPNCNCFAYFTQLFKNGMAKGFKKLKKKPTISLNDIKLNI